MFEGFSCGGQSDFALPCTLELRASALVETAIRLLFSFFELNSEGLTVAFSNLPASGNGITHIVWSLANRNDFSSRVPQNNSTRVEYNTSQKSPRRQSLVDTGIC